MSPGRTLLHVFCHAVLLMCIRKRPFCKQPCAATPLSWQFRESQTVLVVRIHPSYHTRCCYPVSQMYRQIAGASVSRTSSLQLTPKKIGIQSVRRIPFPTSASSYIPVSATSCPFPFRSARPLSSSCRSQTLSYLSLVAPYRRAMLASTATPDVHASLMLPGLTRSTSHTLTTSAIFQCAARVICKH